MRDYVTSKPNNAKYQGLQQVVLDKLHGLTFVLNSLSLGAFEITIFVILCVNFFLRLWNCSDVFLTAYLVNNKEHVKLLLLKLKLLTQFDQ